MECASCVKCCSNLRTGKEETGLTLFTDEVHLFPPELVRPFIGRGVDGATSIFTFQHTLKVCVHLSDKKCGIYENRPLMCRSFPVRLEERGVTFSSGCVGVLNTLKKGGGLEEYQVEIQSSIEMVEKLRKFQNSFEPDEKRWRYNLIEEKWEIY